MAFLFAVWPPLSCDWASRIIPPSRLPKRISAPLSAGRGRVAGKKRQHPPKPDRTKQQPANNAPHRPTPAAASSRAMQPPVRRPHLTKKRDPTFPAAFSTRFESLAPNSLPPKINPSGLSMRLVNSCGRKFCKDFDFLAAPKHHDSHLFHNCSQFRRLFCS